MIGATKSIIIEVVQEDPTETDNADIPHMGLMVKD